MSDPMPYDNLLPKKGLVHMFWKNYGPTNQNLYGFNYVVNMMKRNLGGVGYCGVHVLQLYLVT